MSIVNDVEQSADQEQPELSELQTLNQQIPEEVQDEKKQEEILGDSGLPIDIENAIITCDEYYKKQDEGARNVMIAYWKKLENLFSGIHRTFWDSSAGDWRRIPYEGSDDFIEPVLYDRIINIYRAHGESLIAALSLKLPTTNFLPDDADVAEDIETANAYNKIQALIVKHNQGILLFIKSLLIHFNQGLVASYVYNRAKKEYGTVKVPVYGEDKKIYLYTLSCPVCGYETQEESTEEINFGLDSMTCPDCKAQGQPNVQVSQDILPTITGYEDVPKSRTVIDVFGPLYVQIPLNIKKQELLPIVRLRFEQDNALLREQYGDSLRDKIPIRSGDNASDADRYARNFSNYGYLESTNKSTVTCGWLRKWAFQILDDVELVKKCQERFPDGCYYELLNSKLLARGRNEDLDKHWVFCEHPLSDKLHCDPMGKPLAPLQDLTTEVNDLAIETFEHAIPETFADPLVLDFNAYKKERAAPGMMHKGKRPTDRAMSDAFFTLKPASVNDEIREFDRALETKAQFSVGSFPSLYGGANQTGSKTASEYSESRAMARQRLNITWTVLKFWWAKTMGLAVNQFAESMLEDERYVQKSNQSDISAINVWIRQADLSGRVGSIEPDPDEELPVSFAQVKNALVDILSLNNESLNSGLLAAPNLPLLKQASGLQNLYMPGQNARDKQYAEFKDLLQGIPVEVIPDLDDHGVESDMCQFFLTSSTGLAIKRTNLPGWMAILDHKRQHDSVLAEQEAARAEAAAQQDSENSETKEKE